MNSFVTLTILALALIACCNALGLKDSIDRCSDEADLTSADNAYLKANILKDQPSANVRFFVSCYYGDLGIFSRFNDFSEKLCRKAYVAKFPLKYLTGDKTILDCNTQAKVSGMVTEQQAWDFHVCMVNNGFKY